MTDKRLQLLLDLLEKNQMDAVAINPGPALTYLTGLQFHLMERPTILLVSQKHSPLLILPELEIGKVDQSRIPLQPVTFADDPALWPAAFLTAIEKTGLSHAKIGLEPTRLRFLELNYLQEAAPNATFVGAESIFSELRLCKDALEIKNMREAVRIAQDALTATLPYIKIGRTEKEIAAELVINLLRQGSESELPFAPIVAGGPNSANPHASPSDRALQKGDLLVIDWGGTHQGYFSDLTRTFAISQIDPELHTIYETVKEANAAGRNAGKPNTEASIVDLAARSIIEKAGFGKYFTHRTGHGLGMEAHEMPYMFSTNKQILRPGMVYTVEPGIYLPGKGGVRIEDNMVVTTSGSESLSSFSRDFTVL
ncbi:MAG: aminopeptidase P family protein [Anaerolineaceae bacterium]